MLAAAETRVWKTVWRDWLTICLLWYYFKKHIYIVDRFQSAYRAGHSCETALLRVYNDIVTTVGKGNGSFLVLLDLSAAFDTIDHDNLFYILEKYVGIGGSALRLIRSYFSDRTQRVQIDGIMSFLISISLFMIILVVFASLLIFICVASEELTLRERSRRVPC